MKDYFQASWTKRESFYLVAIPVLILAAISFSLRKLGLQEAIASSSHQALVEGGLYLLQSFIVLAPLLLWTWHKHKGASFGFRKMSIYKIVTETLSHYLLYLGITAIVGVIIIFTQFKIPGYQAQPNMLLHFGNSELSLVIAGLVMVIIAPIVEEVFFRGFLLRTFVKNFDTFLGSVLSAAIFAIFHLQLQSIIPIFILGLIINSLVIRNKSLWPAISFHIMNNAIVFGLQLAILKNALPVDALLS